MGVFPRAPRSCPAAERRFPTRGGLPKNVDDKRTTAAHIHHTWGSLATCTGRHFRTAVPSPGVKVSPSSNSPTGCGRRPVPGWGSVRSRPRRPRGRRRPVLRCEDLSMCWIPIPPSSSPWELSGHDGDGWSLSKSHPYTHGGPSRRAGRAWASLSSSPRVWGSVPVSCGPRPSSRVFPTRGALAAGRVLTYLPVVPSPGVGVSRSDLVVGARTGSSSPGVGSLLLGE